MDAVIRFVANLCYKLAAQDYASRDPDDFLALQHTLVLELAAADLGRSILDAVHTRPAYRDGRWAMASGRGTARMLGAYLAANPREVNGPIEPQHYEQLTTALLIVNDLTLNVPEGTTWSWGVHFFDYTCRPHWGNAFPRAFSLFGERLPNLVPAVGEKFSSRYGIELQEAVAVLFGLYGWQLAPLLGHLKPPPPVTPPFRFGLVNVPDRSSTHPGDRAIKKVLDGWNSSFFSLGEAFSRMELQDPSILPLLRTPVVGFSGDRLWCPDPYLLLVAASEGLFWRLRDLYAENIGPGEEFIALLGKPVFETYVADLFVALGRDDVEQSGKHGDELGLPDFWVRENGLLIVFEAKAGFLSERAKFSRDPDQIDNSIKKLIGKGQMAKAIQRLLETRPDLRHGLDRVIPVLVVLDNSWGAPGLEARVNALANRPSQGAVVEQIHVTPVAELEFAGQWLRNRVFGRLLDWRRRYAPSGDVSLSELLTDFAGPKREATGLALSGFDAQEQARRRVQAVMNDVFDSYRKQFESKT